jgi:hypothetical protein
MLLSFATKKKNSNRVSKIRQTGDYTGKCIGYKIMI